MQLKILELIAGKSFVEVKTLLEASPYFLTVKEDKDYPTLYLCTYEKDSEVKDDVVSECRGLILEKETNAVKCFTFTKSLDSVEDVFNLERFRVEQAIDGTQIRLFYHEGDWRCATTRCIDAGKAFFYSNRSFQQLYQDAMINSGLNLEQLDKEFCYSFVLQHPENRIVVAYEKPRLIHVLSRNLRTLEEENCDIGVEKPAIYSELKTIADVDLALRMPYEKDVVDEGLMLIDDAGKRVKLRRANYKRMKDIRGNSNNLFFHYLHLIKNGTLAEYLVHFPEDASMIAFCEKDFNTFIENIHFHYMEKRINKNNIEIPSYYKKILYDLHGKYLNTGRRITQSVVREELLKLEPKQIMAMINHRFRATATNQS